MGLQKISKSKKQEYDCEGYKNFPEDKKQRSVEYRLASSCIKDFFLPI